MTLTQVESADEDIDDLGWSDEKIDKISKGMIPRQGGPDKGKKVKSPDYQ